MGKYLDPKNDLPFKRIFGEHPELLKSFLNALMPFEKNQYIRSLEYLSAEQVPDNPAKKDSIVDVRCKDNRGRQFIVEMQVYWNNAFSNRMVFNASKAYVRQLDIGEDYTLLQPVYGLGIIDDVFDRNTAEFYHHYKTINCRNNNEVIEGLEFVMIELPKFKPSTMMEKKMAVLWLRFLNEVEDNVYTLSDDLLKNRYIRQAVELCEAGRFSPAELAAYDHYWDVIRTNTAVRKTERSEGLAEGMEKGLAEGMEKGKDEKLKEVVINGYKNGFSIEQIQVYSNLSREQIEKILNSSKET
ncbi:MAG: Rpn family recombination-promoting nuclease/putative transposase [Prevotellaceae bacterium]|jgi:predicted transposase/invertase (TIGR01784 family)|nr:Rpn family recombination-promoting nuclease/putative transposase [Prevotellaceae bacterium]